MKLHATFNTVAAAAVFFLLSGIASLGNANLDETTLASVQRQYAQLNARAVDAAFALFSGSDRMAPKGCARRSGEPGRQV